MSFFAGVCPTPSSRDAIKPFRYHTLHARWWLLLVGLSLMRWGAACPLFTPPAARPLVVGPAFSTQSINDWVWVCPASALPIPLNAARGAGFVVNTDEKQVLIGPAYRHPQAWLYLPLINATKKPRAMVLELDHNRCDTLDVYLLTGNASAARIGHLYRGLPLTRRPLALRTYALPFTLHPRQQAGLLLHSRRTTGVHQLSGTLSTAADFPMYHEQDQLMRLLAMGGFFFSMFTFLALGVVFGHRLLIYFGIYIFPYCLGQLNYNYFFDAFPFPPWLGLTANSVGLWIIFLANTLTHPFGVVYLQHLALFRRWQGYVIGGLTVGNLTGVGLLLAPLTLFTNALVSQASLVLTTLNIGWVFYLALLAWLRRREAYLLVTVLLVFLPLLYWSYRGTTPALNYSAIQPFYYLLIFGYLLVSFFRRELSSRRQTQQDIQRVQTQLAQLRQNEIEQTGRNLHDQLGNTLAAALGYLNLQAPRLGLARDRLLDAIDQTRLISHNLVKDDTRPLAQKLTDLTERFDDFSPINFRYQDFTDGQLDALTPLKQQAIYLIVQEAITNVVKHSGAREATVQAFVSEGLARLTVEDDGIGYRGPGVSGGIGIQNMHKRAALAHLILSVEGSQGSTLVSIETPLTG